MEKQQLREELMNFRRASFRSWTELFHYDWDGSLQMNPALVEEKERSSVTGSQRTHFMSIDLEDYFMVEAFARSVSGETWDRWSSRVVENTKRVLDLFDNYNVKGTFFFLGLVAKKYPELVRDAYARDHGLACHSFWDRAVYSLTPNEFRADTRAALLAVEDAAGDRKSTR